jgi:uncharacterized protein
MSKSRPGAFQVFVKPMGALCNLNCTYCYYLEKQELYKGNKVLKMPEDLLEKYISQHFEACSEEYIIFSWHGGEPLMAGIDFYRKAVEMQEKFNTRGIKIINGIQTNCTLINDEWCRFFSENDFLIGISMDGPENMHNKYRLSKSGEPSFQEVLKGYWLLKKYGITTEILCVVNDFIVKFPKEVYAFFKSLKTEYISFLPLVERVGASSMVTKNSVPALEFGDFLIDIFDEWTEQDIGEIKIQLFQEALRKAFNQDHTLCVFKKTCGGVPVLEHNGDFYSCDHYVNKEHLVGNISEKSLLEMLESKQQYRFGQAKWDSLPNYCLQCEVLDMCNGECPKNRFISTPDGEPGLNYLCAGYKKFFLHCLPFIETVERIWKIR